MAAAHSNLQRSGDDHDPTAGVPTSVLAFILSLLPLRIALLCGTLSRAWKAARGELLYGAAELDFGPDFAEGLSPERCTAAVDLALSLHKSSTLHTLKFFLPQVRSDHPVRMGGVFEAWFKFAASKQLTTLHLVGPPNSPDHCYSPVYAVELRFLRSLSMQNVYIYHGLLKRCLPAALFYPR